MQGDNRTGHCGAVPFIRCSNRWLRCRRRSSAPEFQKKYIDNGHQQARNDMESLLKPPGSEKMLCICRVSRVIPGKSATRITLRASSRSSPPCVVLILAAPSVASIAMLTAVASAPHSSAISRRFLWQRESTDDCWSDERMLACAPASTRGETGYATPRLPIDCSKINPSLKCNHARRMLRFILKGIRSRRSGSIHARPNNLLALPRQMRAL